MVDGECSEVKGKGGEGGEGRYKEGGRKGCKTNHPEAEALEGAGGHLLEDGSPLLR